MRATEFWREQSMMQSLIHGEIPWHIHVTFLHVNIFAHQSECHYFIFFQEISMWKNMNATIEKLQKTQTITTYDIFLISLIFVRFIH